MADTGIRSPSTAAEVNNPSATVGWSSVSNIRSQDGVHSTADSSLSSGEPTEYLQATNFGFSIPASAVIDGIVVHVKGQSTGTGTGYVKLVRSGVIQTTQKSASFSTSSTTRTYGGATDKWDSYGESYTPAIINASNFGCVFHYQSGFIPTTPSIDSIQITVYYTEAGLTYFETGDVQLILVESGGGDTQEMAELDNVLLLIVETGGEGWGNLYREDTGLLLLSAVVDGAAEIFASSDLEEGAPILVLSEGAESIQVGRRARYRVIGVVTHNPYAVSLIKRSR